MRNKITKATDFQSYLAKQLKNSEFKKYYNRYGKQLELEKRVSVLDPTKPD
jgi:hypothetical protein